MRELHLRASQWLEINRDLTEALHHAQNRTEAVARARELGLI